MPVKRIVGLVWQSVQGLLARNGIEISGYIAFTAILALFPFMIFVVSLAGFFGETRTGENFIATLSLFAPPDVVNTLQPAIRQVVQNRNGGLLTLGLLLALYSAGSGVGALRLALNLAYGVEEKRSFWLRKAQDFGIVLFTSIIVILASVVIILGPFLWRVIAWFTSVDAADQSLWHIGRYALTLPIMAGAIVGLHRVLPDTKLSIRQILPGALTTTVVWIIAASLLTLYFGQFANYASTYGSLGGVMVTLMFFYVSGIIFIFGGELNATLLSRHQQRVANPNQELKPSEPHPA
jgi:membrane protein